MMTARALKIGIAALCLALVAPGCEKTPSGSATPTSAAAGDRCPHDIKKEKCPFCNPQLIESDGFCAEHGVAEALCYQCRPYLKTAFRAKGDWCKEHEVPESQCVLCHPELKDKMKPGDGHAAPAPGKG